MRKIEKETPEEIAIDLFIVIIVVIALGLWGYLVVKEEREMAEYRVETSK